MTKKNTPATRSILRPDDIDPDLWALFKASRQGQERVVRRILRQRPTLLSEEWWYTKALHFAVREGHLSVVRHFLSENDDPLWIRHGSEDLVTIASDRGHDEVVRLLREKLKELNVAQPRPVHSAAKSGDVTTIARLLAKNPSTIDVGDDQGMSALHHAVRGGHYTVIELLSDLGANLDLVQAGGGADWYAARRQRPIDIALARGDDRMVGFLLAKGAKYTLDLAAYAGDNQGVRRLCKSRSHRSRFGGIALTLAVGKGLHDVVKELLRGGVKATQAAPNAPSGSALWHAVDRGDSRIAKTLLEGGADPNAWVESSGSPVHRAKDNALKAMLYCYGGAPKTAADFVLDDNIDALAALVANDPKACAATGCGSIYTFLVSFSKTDMLELVLAAGVPLPSVLTKCRTYLWHTPKMTRRLLEAGLDPNLPNWQWVTPLHNIAETNPMWDCKGSSSKDYRREKANRERLIDLFLEFGADPNALDEEYSSSPLGWAARRGSLDSVQLLLDRGADPNAGESWARPLAWAERRGNKDIARALRKGGAL